MLMPSILEKIYLMTGFPSRILIKILWKEYRSGHEDRYKRKRQRI